MKIKDLSVLKSPLGECKGKSSNKRRHLQHRNLIKKFSQEYVKMRPTVAAQPFELLLEMPVSRIGMAVQVLATPLPARNLLMPLGKQCMVA